MRVIVIVVVTGGKQSQLLALALGLGWSLTIIQRKFFKIQRKNMEINILNFVLLNLILFCLNGG